MRTEKKTTLFLLALLPFWLSGGPLEKLCISGIEKHPKVRSLRFKESAKQYQYRQGIDQYLPQISLSAEGGRERYNYQYPGKTIWHKNNYYQYSVTLRQTIYNPILLKKIDDAALQEKVSRLQREDMQAQLLVRIGKTAIEAIRLARIKDLSKRKVSLYRKALEQIRSKFRMRMTDRSDVAQAEARLTKSIGEYTQLEEQYRYTLNNLRYLSNTTRIPSGLLRREFAAGRIANYFRQKEFSHFRKRVERNTQIRLYRLYEKIASNMIGMRKAEHYPTLGIRASYGDSDHPGQTNERDRHQIGLELNVPIFSGGYTTDRVNEAKVLYFSAREDLDNSLLESRVTFERSWEEIRSGIETLRALRKAEAAGKIYYETTLSAYKNGLKSLTDTYLANIDYYDAMSRRIDQEARMLQTLMDLYYIVGEATPRSIAQFEKRYLK